MAKQTTLTLAALALATCGAVATPITIDNGDFAVPLGGGSFTTVGTGPGANQTTIPGWNIEAGTTVDVIGGYWQAPPGFSQSVDMDGYYTASALEQSVYVPNAGIVKVGFWLAGNPDGVPTIKGLEVGLGASDVSFTYNDTGATHTDMGWVYETAEFKVPTAGNYDLSFTSLDNANNAFGPVIGGVSAQVPDGGMNCVLLGGACAALAALKRKLS